MSTTIFVSYFGPFPQLFFHSQLMMIFHCDKSKVDDWHWLTAPCPWAASLYFLFTITITMINFICIVIIKVWLQLFSFFDHRKLKLTRVSIRHWKGNKERKIMSCNGCINKRGCVNEKGCIRQQSCNLNFILGVKGNISSFPNQDVLLADQGYLAFSRTIKSLVNANITFQPPTSQKLKMPN